MPLIGFWNIDSTRSDIAGQNRISELVTAMAIELGLDFVVLIETGVGVNISSPDYFRVGSSERFGTYSRFTPGFVVELFPPIPDDRAQFWHITLPLQRDALFVAIHGPDQWSTPPGFRELYMRQVLENIQLFEHRIGHERTIVFGDFNANPFDTSMAGPSGLHATISSRAANAGPRVILGREHPYFYNPTWNLLGDRRDSGVPASYYYRQSELQWHMLDQVIVRPCLSEHFISNSHRLVTTIRGESLLTDRGRPARKRASDHLPMVFEIDLSSLP